MKKKSALSICFALLFICVSLCGCSPFGRDAESLLAPPKLTGELRPVQEALEKSISGKYSLKFPASGETKSAITLVDLNDDSVNEAVAFYSTSVDNTVTMHISVLSCENGVWNCYATQKIVAGGIERVHFVDTDADNTKEIVVGWNVYGAVDKTVSVYDYTGKTLMTLIEEPYTIFVLCDMDNGFSTDLLTVYLAQSSGSAYAKYFDITARGVAQLGVCTLDSNVTAYYDPMLVKMSDGRYCVYIDCVKGAGLVTEILYVENGALISPFYNTETKETVDTFRPQIVPCRDFDNDSIPEIPIMIEQPVDVNQSASVAYLTVWMAYDGKGLTEKFYTLMNYSDSYSLTLTKEMAENTATVRNLETRERIVYEYDYKSEKFLREIFRVRVVSKSSYDSGIYTDGYIVLGISDTQVWLARLTKEAKNFNVDEKTIKEMFTLIGG